LFGGVLHDGALRAFARLGIARARCAHRARGSDATLSVLSTHTDWRDAVSSPDDVQTLAGSPSSGTRAMTQERADPRAGIAIRIGAVWLALVIVWVGGGLLGRALASHMPFDAWRLIQSVLVGAVGVTIVVAACRLLDRRSLASIGFGMSRTDAAALLAGAGLWLGLAAVGLVIGAATGAFGVTVGPPTLAMVGWVLLQMLLVFTYEAVPEELALRGY